MNIFRWTFKTPLGKFVAILSAPQKLILCYSNSSEMSTLEDKILGEKKEYYCSSSESEEEDVSDDEAAKTVEIDSGPRPLNPSDGEGSVNTGPKGVIKDWQTYKQIEAEGRVERERERLALIQKLSLTCRSELNDEKEDDLEMSDLLQDPFLLEYSKKRMKEMMHKVSDLPKFGSVFSLSSGQDFLDAIDKENKAVTVVVHIYNDKMSECRTMNSCLNEMCKEYPEVKFCKLSAGTAGVSKQFKISGVPALLVYKNGTLVGNFVKVTEELGNDFTANDVENFLIENGMLVDKSCIPSLIRQNEKNNDN